jgi:pentatricopeptide repeat protein
MSLLSNFVDPLGNYVTEVAASMLFGLGYYIFKSKKKNLNRNNDNSNESAELKKEDSKINTKAKLKISLALEKWSYAQTIEEYNKLIKENSNKGSDVYEILNVITMRGLTPNIDTYNALLLNSFYSANFSAANSLKEEILEILSPIQPNQITLNILIKGLGIEYKSLKKDDNFMEDVEKLLTVFNERNISIDVIGFNTILDCLIDLNMLEQAFTYFESNCNNFDNTELKQKIIPDSYTYSTLLKGIKNCETSENRCFLEKAFSFAKLISKLNHEKEESNIIIYNMLLDICFKYGEIQLAEKLFLEIKENVHIKCSEESIEYSYACMIKIYSKIYQIEKALSTFKELKLKLSHINKKPSTILYGNILNASIKNHNFLIFEDICDEIENMKIFKNSFIFSIMINGFRKMKKYEKALTLYEQLVRSDELYKEDKELNIVVFNSILDCCVFCEKFYKMEEIFSYLKKFGEDLRIIPDIITYSILIKGFSKANNLNRVNEIYSFLKENSQKYQIDEIMYNSILDCFARNKDEDNMMKIFTDMREREIKMSVVTYGVIIKLYVNMGDIENAMNIYEDLINKGIRPTVVIYQLLIKLCSKQNIPHKAVDLFRNMLLLKVPADLIIYEYVINICLEHSLIREAGEFIFNSISDQINIDESFYDYFIDLVIYNGMLDNDIKINILNELHDKLNQIYEVNIKILKKIKRFINDNQYRQYSPQNQNNKYNNRTKFNKYDDFLSNTQSTYSKAFTKASTEFEYEIDLTSNQEYFYLPSENNTCNSHFTENFENKNKYRQVQNNHNDRYEKFSYYNKSHHYSNNKYFNKQNHYSQNYNKHGTEKSIYEL